MAIPDFQSFMLPLLRLAADGEEHSLAEVVERLADEFQLSSSPQARLADGFCADVCTDTTSSADRTVRRET